MIVASRKATVARAVPTSELQYWS